VAQATVSPMFGVAGGDGPGELDGSPDIEGDGKLDGVADGNPRVPHAGSVSSTIAPFKHAVPGATDCSGNVTPLSAHANESVHGEGV